MTTRAQANGTNKNGTGGGHEEEPASGKHRTGKQSVSEGIDTENMEERRARLDLEKDALRSDTDGSLRTNILKLAAQGRYVSAENGLRLEDSMVKTAMAQTRAIAIALLAVSEGDPAVGTNMKFEFDAYDAAVALMGVSTFLERMPALLASADDAKPIDESFDGIAP